jgi:hypothetical protein
MTWFCEIQWFNDDAVHLAPVNEVGQERHVVFPQDASTQVEDACSPVSKSHLKPAGAG